MASGKVMEGERSVAAVALATLASRIAGLGRDMMLFALLGLSPWSCAFLFAFTMPNLFRRLLGEGALTSAMLPLFSETLERDSAAAFVFLNRLLTRLFVTVGVLILAFSVLFFSSLPRLTDHWSRALSLCLVLAPYLSFACLAAMLTGALNALGSFGLPALTALWLNVAMLITGGLGLHFFPAGGRSATLLLCSGVLAGGFLQLAFPWYLLHRRGWRFRWDWSTNPLLKRLLGLFLPALLGAAMAQINVTLSRLLAYWLTPGGISTLYLASRLVELPLGIFAISIIAVAFPDLSRSVASSRTHDFADAYGRSRRSILLVTLPSVFGLLILGRSILTLLFAWGNYGTAELARTLPVLWAAVPGIPFFALVGISTRAFHARQDMRTPVIIAAITIMANLLLTVLLVKPLGASGIALANVLAAILQWALLEFCLHPHLDPSPSSGGFRRRTLPLLLANGILILLLVLFQNFLHFPLPQRLSALIQLALAIPLATLAYAAVLRALNFEEVSLLFSFFRPLLRPFRR